MKEREPMQPQTPSVSNAADERLDTLFAAAYPPTDPPAPLSDALQRRLTDLAARHDAHGVATRTWFTWRPVMWLPAVGLAAILFAAFLHGLTRARHDGTIAAPPQVVVMPPRPADPAPVRQHPAPRRDAPAPRRDASPLHVVKNLRPPMPTREAGDVSPVAPAVQVQRSLPPPRDDLRFWNDNPARAAGRWTRLRADEWAAVEARLRQNVRVKDDFVQIPLPRLVDARGSQMAEVVAGYKREAAIVDARLFRKVTLAFKATALSDLCDRLRDDTGIHLVAGRSVADEKVTLFCKEMPLRDVMRQLSRSFGYPWLRSRRDDAYRYEIVQDLRSQLLEEELRNRDRNAALLALDRQMQRYRPYLGLSPDAARARAKTAAPEEKALLEQMAGPGWAPVQFYFRLTAQDLAAMRAGQALMFSTLPGPGQQAMPPEIARGLVQALGDYRFRRQGREVETGLAHAFPEGEPITAFPEARFAAGLALQSNDLGPLTLVGAAGFTLNGEPDRLLAQWEGGVSTLGADFSLASTNGAKIINFPLATGGPLPDAPPPDARARERLARDPALKRHVTLLPEHACAASATPSEAHRVARDRKVSSADLLAALHQATGLNLVADSYTRYYPAATLSARQASLLSVLDRCAERMAMRWEKEGGWLRFRSATYYHDRLKEVPNRLLARWSASRCRQTVLSPADLMEIAGLADAQLDAPGMADGAGTCWGLEEWDVARSRHLRPHLRYLASLSPARQRQAFRAAGLAFTDLTLPGQQAYITLALGTEADPRQVTMEDLARGVLRVEYAVRGGRRWDTPDAAEAPPRLMPRPAYTLPPGVLDATRRFDPSATEKSVREHLSPEPNLTFTYTLGASPERLMRRRVDVNGGGWRDPW